MVLATGKSKVEGDDLMMESERMGERRKGSKLMLYNEPTPMITAFIHS
jgi:hypothetical protein